MDSDNRRSTYGVNLLNQYTNRTVSGFVDILGSAHTNATVTVNGNTASRKGQYFWNTVTLDNSNAPVYAGVTNIAILLGAGVNTNDIIRTNVGNAYLPQTPEGHAYDDDGNLLLDGKWSYTWDGENRLVKMESSADVPVMARRKLQFAYDSQWRRTEKRVANWNGTDYTPQYTNRFIYDSWNLIAILERFK